jgi:hypothetical protein
LLGNTLQDRHGHGRKHTIFYCRELLPGYVETSKGIILPREIVMVKTEKSKTRYLLCLKHINIPIQLDLWGNEVIFM